jgi:hypothetical protein
MREERLAIFLHKKAQQKLVTYARALITMLLPLAWAIECVAQFLSREYLMRCLLIFVVEAVVILDFFDLVHMFFSWSSLAVRVPSLIFCSVHVAVSGLVKILVSDHFVFDGNEDFLHGSFAVPVLQEGKLGRVKLSSWLVNRWDVDHRVEFDSHGNVGVLGTTDDWHEVNAVVKFSVGWANNGSVPVSERLIVSIIKSVRYGTISDSFFSSFKLVK